MLKAFFFWYTKGSDVNEKYMDKNDTNTFMYSSFTDSY